MSTKTSSAAPTRKNGAIESTAALVLPVISSTRPYVSGPRIPENFSSAENSPKNSADLCLGTSEANSERESACEPPCTIPTRKATA
jgi:hypothetical protein